MVTKSARSAVVGSLMEKAGLKIKDDITKTLKHYRVKKDNDDMRKIIKGIENTMNPFKLEPDPNLYCVVTGKQVDDNIKEDLLHCLENGEAQRQAFTRQCFENPEHFEKPIPRRKLKTFVDAAVKSKITAKDQKVLELRGTRDLFGRLLYISTMANVDMSKVFRYPLTPVPLSLAHVDGSMNKTDKSKFMHKLESLHDSTPPESIDVTLVDANFLLYLLQNVPSTFGGIADLLLRQSCAMSRRIDFVCDTYVTPSIKQSERVRRGHDEASFSIMGAEQKRPKDWKQALHSSSFKAAFFRFLVKQWQNDSYGDILTDHEVYLALDSICYRFTVLDGKVHCEDVPLLHCQHEEADTRLVFHLMKAIEASPQDHYSIRSNDTDVLVLLLFHVSQADATPHVWMDAGLSSNNTRRYINITQLSNATDRSLIEALPGLHGLTGCDYTSSFMNKGKLRPFELMKKSTKYCEAVAKLGDEEDLDDDVQIAIESFICALYGKPKMTNANQVRLALFQQHYAPQNDKNPLDKIKGINPSNMPPCQQVLKKKVARANYIAALWKGACLPVPTTQSPLNNGWKLEGGCYCIKWFDGDQMPDTLTEVLGTDFQDHNEDEEHDREWPDDTDDSDDEWE